MPRRPATETNVSDVTAERRLQALQRKIARAQRLTVERNALLDEMSRSGYTQCRLAGLINAANVSEGQPTVSDDAVFKQIKRARLMRASS